MPRTTKGHILIDDTTFPGQVLVAMSTDSVTEDHTSCHMIARHPLSKVWVGNVIGLCLFPSIFGREIADTDVYPADWSESISRRLEKARAFMKMMPVQTQFDVSAANTDDCRITKRYAKSFEVGCSEHHLEYHKADGRRHVNLCCDGHVTHISLHRGNDPEETATDFIIAGFAAHCTVDGVECVASLTDDKLTIVECATFASEIHELGPALVMLFRLMFARILME